MKRKMMLEVDSRLRTEARQLREKNGFSPILHQRIMQSLRTHGLAATPVKPESDLSFWRVVASLAVAAAIALAIWLNLRPVAPSPQSQPVANTGNVMPSVPEIVVVPRLDPTSAALEERKYAYLDRDAQKLFAFVSDQIPRFPDVK